MRNLQNMVFQVKASESGIYMMPVVDGKVVKKEEFDKLDENIKRNMKINLLSFKRK